jgi:thiosulfate dehydrogenase
MWFWWLSVTFLAGCSISAQEYGRELMGESSVSDAYSNSFSCLTCHETIATPTKLRPGYTLYDVSNRPTFWGGFQLELLDSINQCVVDFMRGRPLLPGDDKARAIHVYLDSISPDPSPSPLPLTVVKNIVDLPSGDPAMGKDVWSRSCANCHGAPHTGAGRISTVASLVPDDSLQAHGTDPKTGARIITIEKVRHGKYFNVGGNMPLYSLEALSDDELSAVLGYLEQFGLPKSSLTPSP